jgi:uncharacterized phiE125 gp8 family phage protein
MFDRLQQTEAPSGLMLDLGDVKNHLRVDFDDDDVLIYDLINTATSYIDGPYGLGISLLTQKWTLSLDRFDAYYIKLPLNPVQSVDSITFIDIAGDEQTLDPSLYVVSYGRTPVTIARAFNQVWPVVRQTIGAVSVNFTTGYGTSDQIPADLKHAARLIIGNLYENRAGVIGIESRDSPSEMPLGVEHIFSRYRPLPFG